MTEGRCPHGMEMRRSTLGAWNGGIAFCDCHQANYGYIDSAWMTVTADGEPRSGGVSNDKNLCRECGGQAHKYGDEA